MSKFLKGRFSPINPHKYKGNVSNIIYRSSWELKLLMELDRHPDVLFYSSEEIIVPYISAVDNKQHRYFPDFYVKKRDPKGVIEELLIEVKPYKETQPPKPHPKDGGKPSRRFLNEVKTWGVNSSKWEAAERYCKDKGWRFVIMTEKELGIKW